MKSSTAPAISTATARTCTVATEVGPFTVIVIDHYRGSDDGSGGGAIPTVLASGWTADVDDLLPLIAKDLRPDSVSTVPGIKGVTDRALAYHDGDLAAIDEVPVLQYSGPFLQEAWEALRRVPAGASVTYTELAAKAGRPMAVRAAGSACSRNAAALFVPCHRVVPIVGGVGSFRWNSPVKRWLLTHEGA